MTGFGEARSHDADRSATAEIRAVNNRHLKITVRVNDPYSALESDLEQLVRSSVRRGTVQLSIRVERPRKAEDFRLNLTALASYREQLERLASGPVEWSALLGLPGVVGDLSPATPDLDLTVERPAIMAIATEAIANFEASRVREGTAMAVELRSLAGLIRDGLEQVADRAPMLVQAYHKRLTDRIQALVKEQGVTIEAKDLIREVAILADRSDVSEELVRLRAHLDQYDEILGDDSESGGRKLEFVVQEMGREINTVGSKSNDVEISRVVVEIKGIMERIRELVQNVE